MSSSDSLLQLDTQLCFALYRASRALVRAYGPLLEPLGLTYPQYLALLVLWQEDDIAVKDLGVRLALDSATLTPLLKRLEQQGLLTRHRDPSDERVVRIRLSMQGRALKTKAKRVPENIACKAGFETSDTKEVARLVRLREALHALSADLEKHEA